MAELRVIPNRREECTQSVIERLKEALEQARAGDIAAIGIALVRPHGSINTSFSETDDAGRLLGAATLLQARIAAAC